MSDQSLIYPTPCDKNRLINASTYSIVLTVLNRRNEYHQQVKLIFFEAYLDDEQSIHYFETDLSKM